MFDEDVLLWIVTVRRHVLEDLYSISNCPTVKPLISAYCPTVGLKWVLQLSGGGKESTVFLR